MDDEEFLDRDLSHAFNQRLGQKLQILEELRSFLKERELDVPGIAVIGNQNVGKSSILEKITGIKFPQADELCTRAPTIVQTKPDVHRSGMSAMVSRNPTFTNSVPLFSMEEVQFAIQQENEAIEQQCISSPNIPPIVLDPPIFVQVSRGKSPSLKIADLPGINVSKHGEHDLLPITSGIVQKYAEQDNMILIVVILCNDDIEASLASKIAREVDPKRKRTIYVFSKCDYLHNKEDSVDPILNFLKKYPDTMGIVALANKDDQMRDLSSQEEQDRFMDGHRGLRRIPKHSRGYASLIKKIIDIQESQVRNFIPKAHETLREQMNEIRKELSSLPIAPSSEMEKTEILENSVDDFMQIVRDFVAGNTPENFKEENRQCLVSAEWKKYSDVFRKSVFKQVKQRLTKDLDEFIRAAIENKSGTGLEGDVPADVFWEVVNRVLYDDNITPRTEELINNVKEVMKKMVEVSVTMCSVTDGYKKVESSLIEHAEQFLDERETYVRSVLQMFKNSQKDSKATVEWMQDSIATKIFEQMAKDSRKRISSYVVRTQLSETPETITSLESNQDENGSKQFEHLPDVFVNEEFFEHDSTNELVRMKVKLFVYIDLTVNRYFGVSPYFVKQAMILDFVKSFPKYYRAAIRKTMEIYEILSPDDESSKRRERKEVEMKELKRGIKQLRHLF